MPQPSTKADYQKPAFLGKALGVNSDNFAEDFQWLPKIVSYTSDQTLTKEQSGIIVNNEGATADVNITLPADDDPWIFFIHNVEDVELKVTAATTDTMVTFNDVAADSVAYTTASKQIGGAFIVYCAGSNVVYVMSLTHDGTDQPVTVAT